MPIYERLHNGKKQWCYRCYYTDFNGDRVQKHSKWFNTRKEAVAAESAFMQIKVVGDQNVTFYEVTLKWYEFKSRTLKPSTLDTKRVYLNMEYIKLDRDKSTFKSHRDFSSEIEITFKHF